MKTKTRSIRGAKSAASLSLPSSVFRAESTVFHSWVSRKSSETPLPSSPPTGTAPCLPTGDGEHFCIAAFDEVGRGCLAGPVVAGCTLWKPGKPRTGLTQILTCVDDSKRLSEKQRETLYEATLKAIPVACQPPLGEPEVGLFPAWSPLGSVLPLKESELGPPRDRATDFDSLLATGRSKNFRCLGAGVGHAAPAEIDAHNIWRAVQIAMARAFQFALRASGLSDAEVLPGLILLVDGKLGIHVPPVLADSPQVVAVQGDARFVSIGLASILAKVARDRHMTFLSAEYPQYGFEKHKGYGTAEHLTALQRHNPSPLHRRTFLRGFR